MIDRWRHSKGWTIEVLAEHAGVDIKQIYRIKTEKAVWSTTILKLASALECDPGALLPTTLKSQR
jgi:DNA-binding Xre family transcriptional regulator